MKIALFDRNEYDDVAAYGRYGRVSVHTRFNGRAAADADVLLTTFSRPPAGFRGVVVNLASSDTRHLAGVSPARVVQAPSWNAEAVAAFALARVPADAESVAVVGAGEIGRRVYAALCARPGRLTLWHHADPRITPADVVTLHVRYTGDNAGWFDRHLLSLRNAVLINTARYQLVSKPAVLNAIRTGRVRHYHVDGGPDSYADSRVTVTPHTAWRGPESARARPRVVCEILEKITRGELP